MEHGAMNRNGILRSDIRDKNFGKILRMLDHYRLLR